MLKEINGVPLDDGFEAAFGAFLERKEYDRAEEELFGIVRAAFIAGYAAGKGKPLPPQKPDEEE